MRDTASTTGRGTDGGVVVNHVNGFHHEAKVTVGRTNKPTINVDAIVVFFNLKYLRYCCLSNKLKKSQFALRMLEK